MLLKFQISAETQAIKADKRICIGEIASQAETQPVLEFSLENLQNWFMYFQAIKVWTT